MTKLKSCLFCGGEDIEIQSRQYTDSFYWGACCVCNTCGAKTGDKACEARYNVHDELKRSHKEAENIAKNSAIEAWNTRPELDRLEAINVELVDALEEIAEAINLERADDPMWVVDVAREALAKAKGEGDE